MITKWSMKFLEAITESLNCGTLYKIQNYVIVNRTSFLLTLFDPLGIGD